MVYLSESSCNRNLTPPAVVDIKRYLMAMGEKCLPEEQCLQGVERIGKNCNRDEKHLIHLQLFLHLPYPELEPVYDDPGDFAFMAPPIGFEGFTPQHYGQLVVNCNMIQHFMKAGIALYEEKFMKDLMTIVLDSVVVLGKEKPDSIPFVLFGLGKLSRLAKESSEETGFYLEKFTVVLKYFIGLTEFSRYEKVSYLVRLIGVLIMKEEDSTGLGSDVIELIEEWNFDLTNRVAQASSDYFLEIFKKQPSRSGDGIDAIKIVLETGEVGATEEEKKEWLQTKKTSRLSWMQFIGVNVYLTLSLLDKYKSEIPVDVYEKIQVLLTEFAEHKPKLTCEDFQGDAGDFEHFYKVMKRFGDRDRDRGFLLKKFLEFSYTEVFLTKDGLRVAEKYLVPGGDYETSLAYIRKSLEFTSLPEDIEATVPESVRVIILKLLCLNPELKRRRVELVRETFKNGSHQYFCLSDFTMTLNQICSKIGSIEKGEFSQREHNEDLIYSICFQNPSTACEVFLRSAIRSQQYNVLQIAHPFMTLQSCLNDLSSPPVIDFCMEKILSLLDENDPFFESLIQALPDLISNNIIKRSHIFEILKRNIDSLLFCNRNLLLLRKVFQLLKVMKTLVSTITSPAQSKFLKELYDFLMGIIRLTCSTAMKSTAQDMLTIRNCCLKTMEDITDRGLLKVVGTTSDCIKDWSAFNLEKLALFFIQVPQLRLTIKAYLTGPSNHLEPPNYGDLMDLLVTLVLNSEPELEWIIVMDFIKTTLLQSFELYKSKTPICLVSDGLLTSYCMVSKCDHSVIRDFLKFYKDFINYVWEKEETISGDEQLEIVSTLITLAMKIILTKKTRKYGREKGADDIDLQQLLLILLEVLNWIVERNPDYELNMKSDVLDLIVLLPPLIGKCQPIRKCIMDRVLKQDRKTKEVTNRVENELDELMSGYARLNNANTKTFSDLKP